nr:ATP-binding cassette domain-containing protein [Catenibacterium mitsuokai]
MIEIKNLNISFGDKVILNNASFHTSPGVLTIIRGKSGSGKSTFLKAFQFAYECEYIYEGQRIDELDPDSRQQFIYDHMINVPQIPLFVEGMTIEEHIKQLVKLGYQRNDTYEEKFGIASLKKKYPRNLSGGEKTRVAICLAIMSQPEILILDEPTAALDASYAIEMIKYLKEYAEEGHYVIVATHDQRMIEEADVLYKVDQTLILEKENQRETSLISQIPHNHKLFNLRFSHRTFRIVMNILVIIPARGGSKGIPHKNVKELNGKPLICYSIDAARQLTTDENICVSTDDDVIIKVVEDYGLKVHFKRPAELATDCAGTNGVLLHALEFYEKQGRKYDVVVLLQPTSPFRETKSLKEAVALYTSDIDMVVSVKEAATNPYYNSFEEDAEGLLVISKGDGTIERRQDAPKVWEFNGSIYVINSTRLKEVGLSKLNRIRKYVMDDLHSIDIDSMFDWYMAEKVISSHLIEN